MSWWRRKPNVQLEGFALFRGRWVPRPEDFGSLAETGVLVGSPLRSDAGWSVPLTHKKWGKASLQFIREATPPPPLLIDYDSRLNDDERQDLRSCQTVLHVSAEPQSGNVLADRKDLFRFLFAVLGKEGVGICDGSAQALWSRQGLAEELAHDAELDIDGTYTIHWLHGETPPGSDEPVGFWMHTHGLKELGFFDFDVLDPSSALRGHAHELTRALAFAVVEGTLQPGGEPISLVNNVSVRAVPTRTFVAAQKPGAYPDYQSSLDDGHRDGHVVLCEPASTGFFGRLFGGTGPTASRFLKGAMPEEVLIPFSHAASNLMRQRAFGMLPTFRSLRDEFADLGLPALVKLAYRVDGGGEQDLEHLWFEVHGFQGDSVDATLVNRPFHIERLKENMRGLHPLELLSDWAIFTPAGQINPRQTRTLRFLRQHRAEIEELMKQRRSQGG